MSLVCYTTKPTKTKYMTTQVGQGATRSAALLVDLCWTYSAPWKQIYRGPLQVQWSLVEVPTPPTIREVMAMCLLSVHKVPPRQLGDTWWDLWCNVSGVYDQDQLSWTITICIYAVLCLCSPILFKYKGFSGWDGNTCIFNQIKMKTPECWHALPRHALFVSILA